jgi:penicillin amidase
MIVTANHDIRPRGYELPLVADFFSDHRARRIKERLAQREGWDWELVGELQRDVVSLYAREVVAAIAAPYAGDAGDAFAVLATWDGAMEGDGPAALYALLERRLLADIFGDEAEAAGLEPFADRGALLRLLKGEIDPHWLDDVATPVVESREDTLAAALAGALRDGRRRWGDDLGSWSYTDLHRLTLRHRLDAVPVLGAWMRRGPFAVPGSATTVAAFGARWRDDRLEVLYGPSMRWVVDWSQSETSFAALPGGQSGHPADPHYDDQVRRFLDGKLHPAPWAEEQIEAAVVSRLRLVP